MRAALSIFFVLMVLQTSSAIAEQKTSLFTGIVVKGARGAGGAEVVDVKAGSFSDSAGLKAGDIIVQVDGAKINSLGSFAEHSKKVERKDDIAVVVLRGGNNVNIEILRDPSQAVSRKGPASGMVGFAEEKTHEAVAGTEDVAGEAVEQTKETAHEAVGKTEEAAGSAYEYAGEAKQKAVEKTKEAASGVAEPAAATASGAVGFAEEKTHEAVEGTGDVAGKAVEQSKEIAHDAVKKTEEAAGSAYEYAGEAEQKTVEETKEAASGVAGFAEKETHRAVESAEDVTLDILYADEGIPKEEQQSEGKKTEGGKTE